MEYDEISDKFNKNDMIKSLSDGKVRKYCGSMYLLGGENGVGIDSIDKDLVVYRNGKLADVIEKGIDHQAIAIDNAINTCRRLKCTPSELLQMDYQNELQITKNN